MIRVCIVAMMVLEAIGVWAQETVWTYLPPSGHVDASPAVGDVNGDGRTEVIVGTTGAAVVALDSAGREAWRRDTGDAITISPTIADVTGDASSEVLAVNRRGRVVCLDGKTGALLWDVVLPVPPEWGTTALAVADVDGDGAREIVTGDRDGGVVCLRGSGEEAWGFRGAFGKMQCPALADLDGNGQSEVLIGSEKVSLLCLSSAGKELWRVDQGTGASPVVCNLSGDRSVAIVTGIGKTLQALDAGGKSLWSCAMHREIDSAITVADADGDGAPEVYAVDLSGYLVCTSATGEVRWTGNVEQRVRRSPSVGDVDGDGAAEILVAGYSGAMHVFDVKGNLKARVLLPSVSNATATLAVLGDTGLCVIVPVTTNAVHAFHWKGAAAGAAVAWPEYRHDAQRTGSALVTAKKPPVGLVVDFGHGYVGTNFVQAVVRNPERRRLTVRVEFSRNRGEGSTNEALSDDTLVERSFPYTLPSDESTDLRLTCCVLEGEQVLARREYKAHVVPFTREAADADRMLGTVRGRLPKLLDAGGLEARAFLASGKLDALRSTVGSAGAAGEAERGALRESLAAIVGEARKLDTLSAMAERAAAEGQTTVVRAANPWSPFDGLNDFAKNPDAPRDLAVAAFGNEIESAAVNVFNLSNTTRTYRVTLDALTQGSQTVKGPAAVSAFEVVAAPTERCDYSADALAGLNSASVLQVPAWSARQLWFNVNTRALAPGDWKGGVLLRSLEVTPNELYVPLSVTVWGAKTLERQALSNCGWGYVESSVLKDVPDAALEDQVSHGTNVFVATAPPRARFDESGNLVGEIDFAAHDVYVKRHAPHGIILFCGYQSALEGPGGTGSDAYRKASIQWLRAWVKHMAELGVGYDGFALYPIDEPGLKPGLVTEFLAMAKLAREADPKVLVYTDPVGGITEDELRTMTPYVDIWCPNRGGLLLDPSNLGKLAIMKASGKPVWSYECDDNAKHLSPLGYYRGFAWLAWQHGLTGIGFWSYCTSPDDPWFVPKGRYDYLLIYPGNGVVDSKRWEAVRDGIEDYGMLVQLKQAVEAKGSALKAEDRDAAARVLGEQAAAVAAFCVVDDDKMPLPGVNEAAIRARTADQAWGRVQDARREVARLLEIVQVH